MDGLDCVAGGRAERLVPEREGRPDVRHASRPAEGADAAVKKVLPHKPLIVKLSPNVEDITRDRAGRDRRRGGRALAGEHLHRDGDRHLQAPPAPGERHRRPLRAGDQADRACTWSAASTATSPSAPACRSSAWAACSTGRTPSSSSSPARQRRRDRHGAVRRPGDAEQDLSMDLAEYLKKMKVERLSDLVGALELPGDEPRKTPYP